MIGLLPGTLTALYNGDVLIVHTLDSTSTNPILMPAVRTILPILILSAAYLLWVGANAPGGAFPAGSVLAGAMQSSPILPAGDVLSRSQPKFDAEQSPRLSYAPPMGDCGCQTRMKLTLGRFRSLRVDNFLECAARLRFGSGALGDA